jgi:hypothetical protein
MRAGSGCWKRFRTAGMALVLTVALLAGATAWAAAPAPYETLPASAPSFKDEIRKGRSFLPDDHATAEARSREVRQSIEYPRTEALSFTSASVVGGAKGVTISIPFDTVNGYISHASGQVRVELWRGASQIYTTDVTAQGDGFFYCDFSPPPPAASYDILNGDQVKVTDLSDSPLAPVTIDVNLTSVVTPGTNQVIGVTAAGNTVDIYINTPSFYYCDIPPGADYQRATLSGTGYTATFSKFPLRVGDAAYVFSTYPSGHRIAQTARGGGDYSLVVYPQNDEVLGYAISSTDITVKAGSATQVVRSEGDGFFDAWFASHDILPGEVVSSNIGGVAKSITVADIFARADPGTNRIDGRAPASQIVRVTVTPYTNPVIVETVTDSSGSFAVDLAGLVTLQGNEVFNVTWYDADWDCTIYSYNTYSWYLPEGYTGPGFDEWVLVMNPSGISSEVRVIFQTTNGPVNGPLFTAAANSRSSIHVNEYVPNTMVSTLVTSVDGGQIIAERAMYMYQTVDGKWGAHDSVGILTPSSVWYLPEGYTGPGFDEWVLVQNPNDVKVTVEVRFLTPAGVGSQFNIEVPAMSRYSIHVNEVLQNTDVSTRLESKTVVGKNALPVYAERAMYMISTPDGKIGAHDSIGLSSVRDTWYLPEGCTRPGFDEWVLLMNPNQTPIKAKVSFYTPGGLGQEREYDMAPQSRYSVHVNEIIPNEDVSTVVTCTQGAGVLAERAMYIFTTDGKRGAHDSIGAADPSTVWVLPEGTTRAGFDEWVLVMNPNNQPVKVMVTVLGPAGEAGNRVFDMAPLSRQSVHINEIVSDLDVSTKVESIGTAPLGVVAERAMYMWTADNKQGAHDSIGLPWADIFKR